MSNQNLLLFRTVNLILFAVFCCGFVFAQDKKDDDDSDSTVTKETVVLTAPSVSGIRNGNGNSDDDSKVTGATVRGRLIYEDTSRPARYVLVMLMSDKTEYSIYSSKFVKTDENGEFVIKNVKAGTYIPFIKSEGILNLNSYKFSFRQQFNEDKPDDQFEKIVVGGLGEFQVVVRARRGGSISGRIVYTDGESAVGVKIEALRKDGEYFSNISSRYGNESSVGTAQTDDRGFYRLTGLPEGNYLVRAIEPVSHSQNSSQYIYNVGDNQNSTLRTYYPEGENSKNAKEINVLLGQDQTAIDITLPERQLFGISGKVVKKSNGEPLADFMVNFYKIPEGSEVVAETYSGNMATSNKAGEWSLKSLPKGKYQISVSPGYNYNSNQTAGKNQPQYPNLSKEIEITDKNLADLNFEMPVESIISGTITVEGGKEFPRDVRIFAYSDETRQSGYSDVNYDPNQNKNPQPVNEKTFRIGKLGEGKYRLNFNSQNFYLKSITLGGRDLINSPLEIKENEEIKGVQIVLATDMGTVKGKIAGFDGKEEAAVIMVKPGKNIAESRYSSFGARVKPGGEFEMKAAPGEYLIFVQPYKSRPKNKDDAEQWFQNMIKDAPKISVKTNETTTVSLGMPN